MKKIIALVLVMMLAAMGLSACSTRPTTTTQATEAPVATDEPALTATDAPAEAPAGQPSDAEAPVENSTTTTETEVG